MRLSDDVARGIAERAQKENLAPVPRIVDNFLRRLEVINEKLEESIHILSDNNINLQGPSNRSDPVIGAKVLNKVGVKPAGSYAERFEATMNTTDEMLVRLYTEVRRAQEF